MHVRMWTAYQILAPVRPKMINFFSNSYLLEPKRTRVVKEAAAARGKVSFTTQIDERATLWRTEQLLLGELF